MFIQDDNNVHLISFKQFKLNHALKHSHSRKTKDTKVNVPVTKESTSAFFKMLHANIDKAI